MNQCSKAEKGYICTLPHFSVTSKRGLLSLTENFNNCSEMSCLSLDLNSFYLCKQARKLPLQWNVCFFVCWVIIIIFCSNHFFYQMDVKEKCQGNFPIMTLALLIIVWLCTGEYALVSLLTPTAFSMRSRPLTQRIWIRGKCHPMHIVTSTEKIF